jgi:AcrR family transcriptional regulator
MMPKISDAKRDARRRQILDAALACFSEAGFHQTGMADIVRRSGLSHGAVYLYFPSKDDIIEALAVDRHRSEAALNAAALADADPMNALRSLARSYALSLIDPAGEARRRVGVNGWAEALRNDRVRAAVLEGAEAARSTLGPLIEQLAPDIDYDVVARLLVALFQGMTLQAVWGEPIDVEAALAALDLMLAGLARTKAAAGATVQRTI